MIPSYDERALLFKAFCDENRLRILGLLHSGTKCACDLLDKLQISQSTLSHHMKILCQANVVISQRNGKWIYYSINPESINRAISLLNEFNNPLISSTCYCD